MNARCEEVKWKTTFENRPEGRFTKVIFQNNVPRYVTLDIHWTLVKKAVSYHLSITEPLGLWRLSKWSSHY